MKKRAILLTAILLAFGCFAFLAGCGEAFTDGGTGDTQGDESVTSGKKIEMVGEPQATLDYNEYLGYSIKIKGALKNTGNKNYSYVSISFTLYDESGANIGQALANMNNLAAGETWKYEATSLGFFEEKPVRWKCADITYF